MAGSTSPVARAAPGGGGHDVDGRRPGPGGGPRGAGRGGSGRWCRRARSSSGRCSTPKASSSTLTMGTKQLVVHEALETTTWRAGSNVSSLTPTTNVASASVAGAEMITRLAPPSRWAAAASRAVNSPVDSTTTSTPSSPHGSALGSRSARTSIGPESTHDGGQPSHRHLGAEAAVGRVVAQEVGDGGGRGQVVDRHHLHVGTLARAARRKLRPMRPKPLIPTRTVMSVFPRSCTVVGAPAVRLPGARRKAGGDQSYATGAAQGPSEQTRGHSASLAGSWARPLAGQRERSTTGTHGSPGARSEPGRTAPRRPRRRAPPGRPRASPRRSPPVSGVLGPEVADVDPSGPASPRWPGRIPGTTMAASTLVNSEPGPMTTWSAAAEGVDHLGRRDGVGRHQRHPVDVDGAA